VGILVVVDPAAQLKGVNSGTVWVGSWRPAGLRGGDLALSGSGVGLRPGTTQGAESGAEQSSGSADLLGRVDYNL
jgi:hypothetical protein